MVVGSCGIQFTPHPNPRAGYCQESPSLTPGGLHNFAPIPADVPERLGGVGVTALRAIFREVARFVCCRPALCPGSWVEKR
jgi:hypothetical protein